MGNFKARRMKRIDGSYSSIYITTSSMKDHNTIVRYYNYLLKESEEGRPLILKTVLHERYNNMIMN